jgi:hypothetical protein
MKNYIIKFNLIIINIELYKLISNLLFFIKIGEIKDIHHNKYRGI